MMGLLARLFGRRERPSTDALMVRGVMLLPVVGESYRQDALRAVARIGTDATPFLEELDDYAREAAETEGRRWFRAALVREPNNPKDPQAVAVHASGIGCVGYLTREDAARYEQVFASAAKRGFTALACPAMLTGGDAGRSYGVVLAFSAPGYILQDLTADEREARQAETASRRRTKDERDRAVYEAALAGASWKTIAAEHGYETPSGAYAAAKRYAEHHDLPPPAPRQAKRRPA
jgi:hypothetical protein